MTIKDIILPLAPTMIQNCEICTRKTNFVKDIISYLQSKNYDVDVISKTQDYEDVGFSMSNIEEAANKLSISQQNMMNILKDMEAENVSSQDKLATPVPNKVIIIDSYDSYLSSNQYKHIDIFKGSIGSMIRLGKKANIIIIYIVNSLDSLPINLIGTTNKIILGKADKDSSSSYDVNTDNYDGTITIDNIYNNGKIVCLKL